MDGAVTDVDAIAFDGDDTLWHSETMFSMTHDDYRALMAAHVSRDVLDGELFATEMRNLRRYGYGAKAFTLSMIETAIDVSNGAVTAADIRAIIELGHNLLEHPVELLPGALDAVAAAGERFRLVLLITKGDLFHQESKLARSGLGERFGDVEIVAEKDAATYARVFRRHEIAPERFLMVGDSMRSDIEPVLAAGGWAVHVPQNIVWAHEHVEDAVSLETHPRFRRIRTLEDLPVLLAGGE